MNPTPVNFFEVTDNHQIGLNNRVHILRTVVLRFEQANIQRSIISFTTLPFQVIKKLSENLPANPLVNIGR